jgi:hypothetical protein
LREIEIAVFVFACILGVLSNSLAEKRQKTQEKNKGKKTRKNGFVVQFFFYLPDFLLKVFDVFFGKKCLRWCSFNSPCPLPRRAQISKTQ